MNLTLFRSRHALYAAALSGGFIVVLLLLNAKTGARAGSNPTYVLWSGWTAFAVMLMVTAYSLRKFAHRLGISPEMRWKVPTADLERAETGLSAMRREILRGTLTARADVVSHGNKLLKECGAARVMRLEVRPGTVGGPKFELKLVSTEPLGRVASWLHVHVWFGLASGLLVWLHGGGSLMSPLGWLMNVLTLTVIVTGVIGILLFAVGPGWMTRREKDFSFEDAFVQERSLRQKIKDATAALDHVTLALFHEIGKVTAKDFAVRAAATLGDASKLDPTARAGLQDLLVLVGQRQRILGDLKALARIRFWINIWRVVHIPATLVLLATVVIHIMSVWWY